ncbi:hypothetical protein EV182_005783 [Spiromyces aspiralis]|uniref:Uncharacterized protein n=1 Tax=Spiromyces aspiralis TaxID=68401 RepID=A0ACC1HMB3_9FUNG|nr:hypothetical protein EV182_005783 [Spiromyces aspiralis]
MSTNVKVFTKEEIEKHKTRDDLWMVIDQKVYDHPGGEEVLLEHAGIDATESFKDIGHSDDAVELLKDFYVGDFEGEKLTESPRKLDEGSKDTAPSSSTQASGASPIRWAVPVAIGIALLAYKLYI